MKENTNGFDFRHHTSLGQCLVRVGAITEKQLDRARKVQAARDDAVRIGDVCIALGLCTQADVDRALVEQQSYRDPIPEAKRSKSTDAFQALQLAVDDLDCELKRMRAQPDDEECSGPIKIKL